MQEDFVQLLSYVFGLAFLFSLFAALLVLRSTVRKRRLMQGSRQPDASPSRAGSMAAPEASGPASDE